MNFKFWVKLRISHASQANPSFGPVGCPGYWLHLDSRLRIHSTPTTQCRPIHSQTAAIAIASLRTLLRLISNANCQPQIISPLFARFRAFAAAAASACLFDFCTMFFRLIWLNSSTSTLNLPFSWAMNRYWICNYVSKTSAAFTRWASSIGYLSYGKTFLSEFEFSTQRVLQLIFLFYEMWHTHR